MKSIVLSNKKGLTVMELIVSLTILLLVLGIGYNFFFYANSSYKNTENKWIKQRETRQAAEFISKQVKSAYSMQILSNASATGTSGEYDIYLQSGAVMFRDGTSAPVKIADGNLDLSFDKARNKDNIAMSNVLSYQVTSRDINYSVKSAALLSNMSSSKSITMSTTGGAIHFKNVEDISSIPSTELSSFCFIATAAYGTNTQPSVMVLREFRDKYLMENIAGKYFVDFYYRHSPAIARKIENNDTWKWIVRFLLTPIVGLAFVLMNKLILLSLIIYCMVKIYYSNKKFGSLS